MSETLAYVPEMQEKHTKDLGRVTILEALAEESDAMSIDMSHRSTQMGNGVDAEDN